jgi:hypothetical protein
VAAGGGSKKKTGSEGQRKRPEVDGGRMARRRGSHWPGRRMRRWGWRTAGHEEEEEAVVG